MQLAAGKSFFNRTKTLIRPSTLCKVQINFSILFLGTLSSFCTACIFPVFIISHTAPAGILGSKSQINYRCPVIIGSSAIGLVQNTQVTFYNYLAISGTDCIALCISCHVHRHFSSLCLQSILVCLISFINFYRTAADYIDFTAFISLNTCAVDSNIHVSFNGHSRIIEAGINTVSMIMSQDAGSISICCCVINLNCKVAIKYSFAVSHRINAHNSLLADYIDGCISLDSQHVIASGKISIHGAYLNARGDSGS